MGEYRDVERIGEISLDAASVETLVAYLATADLPETHNAEGDTPTDGLYDARGNPGYNKYILYDDIFARFFGNDSEYQYFMHEVIHTAPLPLDLDAEGEYQIKAMVGAIHAFFTEYYKKFFMLRISVSITEPQAAMHYHRDLAGENADRFLIDLTDSEEKLSGIQIEERLYKLDRLAVYKLDTTREHRAVNYSLEKRKISLIIQGISELAQYIEYQRKHMEVYTAIKHQNFQR